MKRYWLESNDEAFSIDFVKVKKISFFDSFLYMHSVYGMWMRAGTPQPQIRINFLRV
jgi:hypothetical protein